jgi:hypothetical protein
MDAKVEEGEVPPHLPSELDVMNDFDPEGPIDDPEEQVTDEDKVGHCKAPSRLSSIVTTDSSVLRLSRRDPVISMFEDHFSLPASSNVIRFRHRLNAARVYDEGVFQTVVEEEYDKETDTATITVKKMKDSTSGTIILRVSYSIVTALWTG